MYNKGMKHRNRLILLFFYISLVFSCSKKPLELWFYNISSDMAAPILEYFSNTVVKYFSSQEELLDYINQGNKGDILLFRQEKLITDYPELFTPLSTENTGVMPRSIRQIGLSGETRLAYALALDSREVLLRKDLYLPFADQEGKIALSFNQWEAFMSSQTGDQFYPLMVAGKEDALLLDFLYLLLLEKAGEEAIPVLDSHIQAGDSLAQIRSLYWQQGDMEEVIETLSDWRKKGILHPEWYNFTLQDILSFSENRMTGALILNLSTHRSLDVRIFRDYSSLPFPQNGTSGSTLPYYASPILAAIPASCRNTKRVEPLLNSMVEQEFQKEFSYFTGLIPVHSTITALDVQASDGRFWAAASKSILTTEPALSENEEYHKFLQELRIYLKTR